MAGRRDSTFLKVDERERLMKELHGSGFTGTSTSTTTARATSTIATQARPSSDRTNNKNNNSNNNQPRTRRRGRPSSITTINTSGGGGGNNNSNRNSNVNKSTRPTGNFYEATPSSSAVMKGVVSTVSQRNAASAITNINNTNNSSNNNIHNTGCLVCGLDTHHDKLLICDSCNGEYHMYCLVPAMVTLPDTEWYCDRCKPDYGDGLELLVMALPPSYTCRFGEICWAQGGVGYGWWPSCIYDPRLTIGGARMEARKALGKKHLVYFFQCDEAPFAVLPESRTLRWEDGLIEGLYFGRTATLSGRMHQFQQALQAAVVEAGKPPERRLDWNHQEQPEQHLSPSHLPSPVKAGASAAATKPPKKMVRNRKRTAKERKESEDENDVSYGNSKSDHVKATVAPQGDDTNQTSKQPQQQKQKRVARREKDNVEDSVDESNSTVESNMDDRESSSDSNVESTIPEPPRSIANPPASPIIRQEQQQQEEEEQQLQDKSNSRQRNRNNNGRATAAPSAAPAIEPAWSTPARGVETDNDDDNSSNTATADDDVRDFSALLFCQINKRVRDNPNNNNNQSHSEVTLGFIQLKSNRATFAQLREAIVNELDAVPVGWEWRFYLPPLGPVSLKQETRFGSMLKFLQQILPGCHFGEGTAMNPVRLLIDDAPLSTTTTTSSLALGPFSPS